MLKATYGSHWSLQSWDKWTYRMIFTELSSFVECLQQQQTSHRNGPRQLLFPTTPAFHEASFVYEKTVNISMTGETQHPNIISSYQYVFFFRDCSNERLPYITLNKAERLLQTSVTLYIAEEIEYAIRYGHHMMKVSCLESATPLLGKPRDAGFVVRHSHHRHIHAYHLYPGMQVYII